MKKIYSLLFLAALCSQPIFAQTCASPYAAGVVPFSENCSPTGSASYNIEVIAISDSALVFMGLWEVPSSTIDADIDCQNQSFSIARQLILSGYYIEGQGALNSPNVSIEYSIYSDTISTTPLDQCVGIYLGIATGLRAGLEANCTLSPNPTHASTLLQIKGNDSPGGTWNYRVLDMQGRDVQVGALDADMQATIDTQRMATGMYRVVVQSSDGQWTSKVLVVQ